MATGERTWKQERKAKRISKRVRRRITAQAKHLERAKDPSGAAAGWLVWQVSLIVVFCLGLLVGKNC